MNSPWGVVGLVVCALVVIYANVIQPMLSESGAVSADAEDEGFEDFAELEMDDGDAFVDEGRGGAAQKNLSSLDKRIDFNSLIWLENGIRDPFTEVKQVDVVRPNKRQGVNVKPVLTAIIAGSDVNLAVLDGEVVAAGNAIGEFIVASIGQSSVHLKGPVGNLVISINGEP